MTIKNITVVLSLLAVLSGTSACEDKGPKPQPLPTTTIDATVVQMCIDQSTDIRYKNEVCQKMIDGFIWVWIVNDPNWPAYIPAAGQKIQNGRYRIRKPEGMQIVLAPDDGGYFQR